MLFKRNTKYYYYVQWDYQIFHKDDWMPSFETKSRKKAMKHALKMLARNSNVAPWRVVEYDEIEGGLRVIFKGGPKNKKIKKLRR